MTVQSQSGNAVSVAAALIGIDWGTTSFRAYLFASDGELLDRIDRPAGILTVEDGNFGVVLQTACEEWMREHPAIPVLMCGMIGSRHGWRDVPYVVGEAGAVELASASVIVQEEPNRIQIVPGLQATSFDGGPDVMRGEETMLIGAVATGAPQTALFCLPGTHSKWVAVQNGNIGSFSTYLTGELFAMLKERSVLAGLIAEESNRPAALHEKSFHQGLAMASDGTSLLHRLFSIRAQYLTESSPPYVVEDVLSGLLIGTELISVSQQLQQHSGKVTLLSSGTIAERYCNALAFMGHAPECFESNEACMIGLCSIAEKLGHISSTDRGARAHLQETIL